MSVQKTMSSRAWLELLILSALWGGSFLVVEYALIELPVLTIVALRVLPAMLILWAYVLIRGLPVPRAPAIWGAFLVMGLLNNAIPFALLTYGQVFIESGLTSILNGATAPFGVVLAAIFFVDERLTVRKSIGVSLGFFGILIAIGPANLGSFDPRSVGQLAVIGATVSYGFAGVWARKHLVGLAGPVAAAGMLTGSSLMIVPYALWVDGFPNLSLLPATIASMAYYAIFATALAYLLYYRVLAMAGSGNLMLVTLFVPVIAILLGAIMLGETLEPSALVGFLVIALGMVILDGRVATWLRARLSN